MTAANHNIMTGFSGVRGRGSLFLNELRPGCRYSLGTPQNNDPSLVLYSKSDPFL